MVMSFHQKENKYLEQINKGSQTEQNKLKLVSLYMDSKNYFMAKPLLEELCRTMPQSGDVYFYLGCLASQSNILRKADQYFQTAIRYDPKLRKQIDAYLQTLGDDFLKFARYFKTQPGRELSIKYMVQKGLKYNPNHSELKKELETLLKRDLKKIKSDIDTDNFQESAKLITKWYQTAMDQPHLFTSLPLELAGNIFLYQGKLFLSQKDYPNSLASLDRKSVV